MTPRCSALPILAAVLLGSTAHAGPYDDLRQRWLIEAQRLEAAQEQYAETVDGQAASLQRLQGAREAVDAAIADPNVRVAELRRLEAALTSARDEALRLAEDAAAVRRRIYEQIELVEDIGAQVEAMRGRKLVEDAGIAGTWRAEWGETGEFGLVRLAANGNLIQGSFRLTNGNAGSLTGTFGGGELRLDIVSSSSGFAGSLTARLDAEGNRAEGTWSRTDVGGGRRAAGSLELTRLDDEEAADVLSGMR